MRNNMREAMFPDRDTVDLMRFSREKELLCELLNDSAIARISAEIKEQGDFDIERKRLLANSLRVTERIMPELIDTVQEAQRIANILDKDIEVYIYSDVHLNAACADYGKDTLFVMLSSALVEGLTNKELLFVIGHELGHATYCHHDLPAKAILSGNSKIPVTGALKLMSWSRCAEISADRIGLLCCQDIDIATTVLVKLTSGLTKMHLDPKALRLNIKDSMAEMDRLPFEKKDLTDFLSDHPYSPLRVEALSHFWDSRLLGDFLKTPETTMSIVDVDAHINSLLAHMEPQSEGSKEEAQLAKKSCLLWGGFSVAVADNRLLLSELDSIKDIVKDDRMFESVKHEIAKSHTPDKLIREKFHQAVVTFRRCPLAERQMLIVELVAVALADGAVQIEEQTRLRKISHEISVDPVFVDQVLKRYI